MRSLIQQMIKSPLEENIPRAKCMDTSIKLIEVLYEDEFYIVFNKPAGLLVIPSPQQERKTLLGMVNEQFPPVPSGENQGKLHPCHRLDRDTSGVILFARGKKNQQMMMEEFHNQQVQKNYIAFIQGKLKNSAGEIKSAIKDFNERRFHQASLPKMSITRYKVLTVKKNFSVVQVNPLTGRTNQIRIHFSEIGHPLIGERKYAFGKDYALKFRRAALHAQDLRWIHPIYKKQIQVHSPLPEDMKQFLQKN